MLDDGRSSLDEDVVPLYSTNVAYRCDDRFALSLGWPGDCTPVGKVEAIVDSLYASWIDSINLDAMAPDLLRDGEDRVGNSRHDAIGDTVLAGPENSHVPATPDQLCF